MRWEVALSENERDARYTGVFDIGICTDNRVTPIQQLPIALLLERRNRFFKRRVHAMVAAVPVLNTQEAPPA